MKFFKNNQIIIYVIALMLVTAGYLNYNANSSSIPTNANVLVGNKVSQENENIGDATLVSSNAVIENNEAIEETSNTNIENETETAAEIADEKDNNTTPTSEVLAQVNSNDYNHNDEYFAKSKLDRDNMYSQTIETYQKMLDSTNTSNEQKKTATQEIAKKNSERNSIMICENLLETKGFANCVIFVNNKSISVIIDAEELKQEDIAQIQNIISREMGANVDDIHITNK